MTPPELLAALLDATTSSAVADLINSFSEEHPTHIGWKPVGKPNNRGPIEVGGDSGKMLVERVTNAIDAVLDFEFHRHNGLPRCRTPREAAQAWLGVSPEGLHSMSPAERRRVANKVVMTVHEGDSRERRTVDIRDFGLGLSAARMPDTILSLNEGNKLDKFHLAGAYGQGGSSTFSSARYTLIASRSAVANSPVAFSVVFYQDLPPEQFKQGSYVFFTWDGLPFEAPFSTDAFPVGTLVRHFGYDLSQYTSPLGERSVYGLLQQGLFDPVIPIWLEDKPHNYRRVIKGSRNGLNGVADDDAGEAAEPSELPHRMEMFHSRLGDFGTIGIEYWVLPYRERSRPNAAFVNPLRPIIFTHNGQSHGELPASLIKKDAELPYLPSRMVVHIACDGLSAHAKRGLFVSNREGLRTGEVLTAIKAEIVRALKSDEELGRLNTEAEQQGLRQRDAEAERRIRSEVARMLRTLGYQSIEPVGGAGSPEANQPIARPGRPRGPRPPVVPIPVVDPPTLLEFAGDRPVKFYPTQRRYLRVRTNAPSNYYSADRALSRFNLILPPGLVDAGSTRLNNGRMRLMVDAPENARIGTTGTITLELSRPGLESLRAQLNYEIVAMPETPPAGARIGLPPFTPIPVTGPEDPNWALREWPDDVSQVASDAVFSDGHLNIYYSLAYPNFVQAKTRFERQSPALAESFRQRYEVWVCMHSLLLWQEQNTNAAAQEPAEQQLSDDQQARVERAERCRLAVLASMFAAQEVQNRPEAVSAEE